MAGTHTPDSLRCRHAGSAWSIECDGDRVTRYERLAPGEIAFRRLTQELLSADDLVEDAGGAATASLAGDPPAKRVKIGGGEEA
jgi:hypothetical protein